jgi:hypothetical protein
VRTNNGNNNTAAAVIAVEKILDGNVREREGSNGRISTSSRERVQWLVLVNGAVESAHDTKREAGAHAERLRAQLADDRLREADRLAACGRAQEASKGGFVQHVNCVAGGYTVSDWYDGDCTVASFENGRAL